ncbi:hypothetical protein GCM10027347_60640 [Larkinella harenae]
MKKLLILLCLLLAVSTHAQTFKPFKVNLSLGFASTISKNPSAGAVFSLEPKYGVSDHLDLGLRLESAAIGTSIYINDVYSQKADAKALNSGVVSATYLVTLGSIRPFIGLGAGIYGIYGTTITIPSDQNQTPTRGEVGSEAKFGTMLRAGLKVGHFTAAVEYNGIPNSKASLSQTTIEQKNKYITLKIGVDFGGGRR